MDESEVRSIIPQHVNVMALAATATKGTLQQIMKVLGMTVSTCSVINVSPKKANMYLTVKEKVSIEEYVVRVSIVLVQDGIFEKVAYFLSNV